MSERITSSPSARPERTSHPAGRRRRARRAADGAVAAHDEHLLAAALQRGAARQPQHRGQALGDHLDVDAQVVAQRAVRGLGEGDAESARPSFDRREDRLDGAVERARRRR
jgi:hypothetical protein